MCRKHFAIDLGVPQKFRYRLKFAMTFKALQKLGIKLRNKVYSRNRLWTTFSLLIYKNELILIVNNWVFPGPVSRITRHPINHRFLDCYVNLDRNISLQKLLQFLHLLWGKLWKCLVIICYTGSFDMFHNAYFIKWIVLVFVIFMLRYRRPILYIF